MSNSYLCMNRVTTDAVLLFVNDTIKVLENDTISICVQLETLGDILIPINATLVGMF